MRVSNLRYMSLIRDRLLDARLRAGFETASDAAARFGWNKFTYLSHENGNRNITIKKAREYAKAFKVDPTWLLTGEGDAGIELGPDQADETDVPLVGIVGAGASVHPLHDDASPTCR